MDLSKCHNPYDFANPVFDELLFIGRKNELEEIRYYLDHTMTAPRPINIALLGARASGKTSLLNMTEHEARKRNFCIARVDLDEDDAKTQLCFFYKLFDVILSSACDLGAYGGKEGKTFDTYLDMVNAYTIPDDKTFCPLLFPLQYSKAMCAGNINVPLSDNNYKNDLIKIRNELNRPIVILFDECNVLANSRVHLEKLRNIFMNIPGYMLVFTGTPDLFPVMDDIFSPIIRQFKKINVAEFEDNNETEELIRKPLEIIGINPEDIFDFETYIDVNEIHELCGGRPYEIQLICHVLFRRVQNRRAKKMKLDLSVLEDVRKELETSQDITIRPIITKIRNLKKSRLSALRLLCTCDGYATFDQVWSIEYILSSSKKWTKDVLQRELEHFTDDGIIIIKDGVINFAGDDFDRIYAKYFAREQRVPLHFPKYPLEIYWNFRLRDYLKNINNIKSMPGIITSALNLDFVDISSKMASEKTDSDIFVEGPPFLADLYFLMIDYREKSIIPLLQIKINLSWLNVQCWYYSVNANNVKVIDEALFKFAVLKERVSKLGGQLIAEIIELPVAPIDVLVRKINQTANEKFREKIVTNHNSRLIKEYVEKTNIEEALFNANLLLKYKPNASSCNNLGYFFMACKELDKANGLLERAISISEDSSTSALASYNLGILHIKCDNIHSALKNINSCINKIENMNKRDRQCSCVFVPKLRNGRVEFEENKQQPDLLEIALEAKILLETHLANCG